MSMRIAVDVMGSDLGSAVITRGALNAQKAHDDIHLLLVGASDEIRAVCEAEGVDESKYDVIDTSVVIGMDEHPIEALKAKRDASLVKAVALVSDGKADAVVSPGSTGALVAASQLMLRLLPGVRRAGIVTTLPALEGRFTILDVGANPNSKPAHLFQYGVMGSLFSQACMQVEKPRVAMLSIGSEKGKGNPLIKSAFSQLDKAEINFVGNIEGHDIFQGKADVVVCDGFVGNVVLKIAEGLSDALISLFKTTAQELELLNDPAVRKMFGVVKQRVDWTEVGGAQLLGVNGVVVVAHGRSNEAAIQGAVSTARRVVEAKLNQGIIEALYKRPSNASAAASL